MKSVLSDKCCKKEEKPFPKLMKHCEYGSIYLMSRSNEGTVVYSGIGSMNKIGKHFSNTLSKNLTDYEGDVCLTND